MPELIAPIYVSRPLDVMALAESRDWGLDSLKITDPIWDDTRGEGVLYVVGDTGLVTSDMHRDAKPAEFAENFTTSNTVEDRQGHGSHVAGTVIAQHNDWGFKGIAPDAGYAVLKLLGDNGSNTSDRIEKGYYWLANWWKNRSVQMRRKYHTCVLNLSLGGPATASGKKAIQAMQDVGIVVIAAMGNSGRKSYEEPGIYAIGTAAIDTRDRKASFSTFNEYTDVAGPGVGIVSFGPRSTFVEMSGTSMAAPNISGCGILTLSANRDPELRTHDGLIEYWTANSPFDLDAPGKDQNTGLGKPNMAEVIKRSQLFNFGVFGDEPNA